MGELFFPQLASGALAQYPIQKTRLVPTIKNVLLDGSMILASELNFNPHASRLLFQLSYSNLETADMQALQAHFEACLGPLRAFTFIDPTDNMLASSSDLTATGWQRGAIQIVPGATDPNGDGEAFVLTNVSQASQGIVQTLAVPAHYQYCLSAYVTSTQAGSVVLSRTGTSASNSTVVQVGSSWTRVISSGRLNDGGTTFTAGLILMPGQQVTVYGMQLEAQLQPSRYRATRGMGGVYTRAHWAVDEFPIMAQAPNLFSTSFSIETNV
ncbi:MAG TPA: hypothetical protein VLJ11_19210 [Bryobacteraceae bacterium]|nr:hypothetical protein [Bryobacteraceae bacterium]